ncbi:hypothetical protein PC123_g24441 [Phytophthora cactorum]|nr:hypothetical protein PC123_g24441 [Phytophthora cactorum]
MQAKAHVLLVRLLPKLVRATGATAVVLEPYTVERIWIPMSLVVVALVVAPIGPKHQGERGASGGRALGDVPAAEDGMDRSAISTGCAGYASPVVPEASRQFQRAVETVNFGTVQRGVKNYVALSRVKNPNWRVLMESDPTNVTDVDEVMSDFEEEESEAFDPADVLPSSLAEIEAIRKMRFMPSQEVEAPS